MKYGVALSGMFANPPWPGTVPIPIATVKQAGCDFVSVPVWPLDLLSGPVISTTRTTVQQAVNSLNSAGLQTLVVPHNDGNDTDAIRLQYFQDFPSALIRFSAICTILPKGTLIELWNEADYSEEDAGKYGLSWGSVGTLYSNAKQLVAIAKAHGLLVALPAPLDQSPEQTLLMQNNDSFPWEQMGIIGADYLTYHVYDVIGGLPLRDRLRVCTDTANQLGLPLLVSETNFGPDSWKITNVEKEYIVQNIPRVYWQMIMDPPSPSDFSNLIVQQALIKARTVSSTNVPKM